MSGFSELFPTFASLPRRIWSLALRFGRKVGKPLLIVVAVLFVAQLVAHGIATVVLGRKVEAKLSEIKASGAPVSAIELGEPKIPDDENAAVIYARIFQEFFGVELDLSSGTSKETNDHESLPNVHSVVEELGLGGRQVDPTTWRYARAQVDQESWERARAIMARYSGVLPLLEEAVRRPHCQFAVNWHEPQRLRLAHLSPMRALSQFLRVRALLAAREGSLDEALRSVELSYRAAESLREEPHVIGFLVKSSMISMASASLNDVVQSRDLNVAQATRLYDCLSMIDLIPGYVRGMEGERAMGNACFHLYANRGNRPFLYADQLFYLGYMERIIETAHLPYRELKLYHSEVLTSPEVPFYAPLSKTVAPMFEHAPARRDETIARVAGDRTMLALLAHKDKFDSYPETLDDLRDKLGWEIPKDPFSGEDFIYRREGKGFLLYSVGKNLEDEEARLPKMGDPVDDIVWRMDH